MSTAHTHEGDHSFDETAGLPKHTFRNTRTTRRVAFFHSQRDAPQYRAHNQSANLKEQMLAVCERFETSTMVDDEVLRCKGSATEQVYDCHSTECVGACLTFGFVCWSVLKSFVTWKAIIRIKSPCKCSDSSFKSEGFYGFIPTTSSCNALKKRWSKSPVSYLTS